MHGGIAVITVRAVQNISGRLDLSHCGYTRITVIVTVVVLVPGQAALIAVAVAVVVNTVTNLYRIRIHGRIGVVTIGIIQYVSRWFGDGCHGYGGITEVIAVIVLVPNQAAFINKTVTVVINRSIA